MAAGAGAAPRHVCQLPSIKRALGAYNVLRAVPDNQRSLRKWWHMRIYPGLELDVDASDKSLNLDFIRSRECSIPKCLF